MPNLTTSADIDTFMGSATNAAARTNLGVLPLTGGTLTGALTLPNSIFSGLSLTGSQATNTIDVSTTWNTTGNPSLIYGRVTRTAVGGSAKLIDLGLTSSLFSVDQYGTITADSASLNGIYLVGTRLGLSSTNAIAWTNGNATGTMTTILTQAAAATLQLGTSLVSGWVSQTIAAGGGRIGTDTNNSPTNTLTIAGSISTGTGTGGNLRLGVYGTNGTSGTAIGTLNTVLTVVAARKVINIAGIPTSSAGLSSGDVYSNAGILTIVA